MTWFCPIVQGFQIDEMRENRDPRIPSDLRNTGRECRQTSLKTTRERPGKASTRVSYMYHILPYLSPPIIAPYHSFWISR